MRRAVLAVAAAALLAGGCDRARATSGAATAPAAASAAQPAPAGRGAPSPATAGTTPQPTAANTAERSAADDSAQPPAAANAASAAAPAPARELTLPAGTRLPIVLETPVGSDTSRVEERVDARVARAIVVHGVAAVPAGSTVAGVVTAATRAGRVKGRAHVALRFETLVPRGSGEHYAIRTAPIGRLAPATKGKDALEILGPATGGAIIGRLVGGRSGALTGAAVGGGAGAAVVMSTRGKEVRLPRGTALTLKLTAPLTLRVP